MSPCRTGHNSQAPTIVAKSTAAAGRVVYNACYTTAACSRHSALQVTSFNCCIRLRSEGTNTCTCPEQLYATAVTHRHHRSVSQIYCPCLTTLRTVSHMHATLMPILFPAQCKCTLLHGTSITVHHVPTCPKTATSRR
jgi:hypothetical protein